jgi:hypothetical protein
MQIRQKIGNADDRMPERRVKVGSSRERRSCRRVASPNHKLRHDVEIQRHNTAAADGEEIGTKEYSHSCTFARPERRVTVS